jgi:predicted  nucleic acid-binding Zn-ribbon protein
MAAEKDEVAELKSQIHALEECNQVLEGRIRGLEALVIEFPDVTPAEVRAAKEKLRTAYKNRNRHTAELKDKINAPYDKHAEAALDDLARKAEVRASGNAPSV